LYSKVCRYNNQLQISFRTVHVMTPILSYKFLNLFVQAKYYKDVPSLAVAGEDDEMSELVHQIHESLTANVSWVVDQTSLHRENNRTSNPITGVMNTVASARERPFSSRKTCSEDNDNIVCTEVLPCQQLGSAEFQAEHRCRQTTVLDESTEKNMRKVVDLNITNDSYSNMRTMLRIRNEWLRESPWLQGVMEARGMYFACRQSGRTSVHDSYSSEDSSLENPQVLELTLSESTQSYARYRCEKVNNIASNNQPKTISSLSKTIVSSHPANNLRVLPRNHVIEREYDDWITTVTSNVIHQLIYSTVRVYYMPTIVVKTATMYDNVDIKDGFKVSSDSVQTDQPSQHKQFINTTSTLVTYPQVLKSNKEKKRKHDQDIDSDKFLRCTNVQVQPQLPCSHLLPPILQGSGPSCGYCGFQDAHGKHEFHLSQQVRRQHNRRSHKKNKIKKRGFRISQLFPTPYLWEPYSLSREAMPPKTEIKLNIFQSKRRRTSQACVRHLTRLLGDDGLMPRKLHLPLSHVWPVQQKTKLIQIIVRLWILITQHCASYVHSFNYQFQYHVVIVLYYAVYGVFLLDEHHENVFSTKNNKMCDGFADKCDKDSMEMVCNKHSCNFLLHRRDQPRYIKVRQIVPQFPLLSGCLPYATDLQQFKFSLAIVGESHAVFLLSMQHIPWKEIGVLDDDTFPPSIVDSFQFGPSTVFI
jgi:hypothetical protein